jgi:hypothetical protein
LRKPLEEALVAYRGPIGGLELVIFEVFPKCNDELVEWIKALLGKFRRMGFERVKIKWTDSKWSSHGARITRAAVEFHAWADLRICNSHEYFRGLQMRVKHDYRPKQKRNRR